MGGTGEHFPTNRIPSLDSLRAIAISLVVIAHLSGAPLFVSLPDMVADSLGDTGVRLFFVLSGYLITALLLREHAKAGKIDLAGFYVRRIFRIAPPFYLYLAVLGVAAGAGIIILDQGDLANAALYLIDYCPWYSTSNYVRHIWSLSIEEQFYLLWPIAIWVLGPKKAKWIAVASLLLSPVWRLLIFHFLPDAAETIDRRFDAMSDALATGCLLACFEGRLLASKHYLAILESRAVHVLPILALLSSAFSSHPHYSLLAGISLQNFALALYLSWCVQAAPTWLNGPFLGKIGLMSYSIYLWQQAFCADQGGAPRLAAPLALALTLAFGWLSFRFVETPFQVMGRSLAANALLRRRLARLLQRTA